MIRSSLTAGMVRLSVEPGLLGEAKGLGEVEEA
jgi:hypothetical protein